MSDDRRETQNALMPLSPETQRSRTSLVSRGLADVSRSTRLAALEAIHLITRHVTVALDVDELLEILCQQLYEANNWLGVEHVVVLLVHENEYYVRAHQGRLIPRAGVGRKVAETDVMAVRSLSTQGSVLENDINGMVGCVPMCSEAQSEICVPLVYFGETLGTLVLDCARKNAFSAEDVENLEALAEICATAIQNAGYFNRLRRLAYTDLLTGVYNRRYFEMRIVEELERAQRFKGAVSLIMADVDMLNRLNDEFGSDLGDEVLRSTGTILEQALRKCDLACRYSQGTFGVIVPETTLENALRVAEKLRRAVENHHFPGVPRLVSISCGVADYPKLGGTRDQLVAAAEKAMHLAKSAGRNRVAAAG